MRNAYLLDECVLIGTLTLGRNRGKAILWELFNFELVKCLAIFRN